MEVREQIKQPTFPLQSYQADVTRSEIQKQSLCKPKRFTIPLPFRQSNSGTFGAPGPEDLAGASFASWTSFKLKAAFQFPCASSIVPGFTSPALPSAHQPCVGSASKGKSWEVNGVPEAMKQMLTCCHRHCSFPSHAVLPRWVRQQRVRGGDGGGTGAPAWPEDYSFLQQLV